MFNIETFDIKVDTELIGRNFVYAEEVDSTNSVLLNKANKFNVNGTVILAEKQLKGKGRKERVWYSAKDQNLTFSILLNEKKYLKNINIINFISSLSVALSIENLYQLKPELKWPNDVLLSGKKTAGILIESYSKGSKIESLVTGIGVNVNQSFFQGTFNIPPTSLKIELEQIIDRERLLAEILNIFEELLFKSLTDKDAILKDWKLRCGMIGEKISIVEGEKTKYGIFEDIDENGFLLLKHRDKTERITFGDVTLA